MGGFEGVVCQKWGDFVSTYIFNIVSSLAQAITSVCCVCPGVNVFVLLVLKNAFIIMQIVLLAVIILCRIFLSFHTNDDI